MRACALAILVALAGCRANPSFLFADDHGEDRQGDSESDSNDTAADSDSNDTGTATGAPICEPHVTTPDDECQPWQALPLWLFEGFNVADTPLLRAVDCTATTQIVVKRVGGDLQQCNDGCDQPCDPALRMDVSFAGSVALLAPLLPAEGECAKLWHVGQPDPDPESDLTCLTAGFALLDDEADPRLRVAVAFNTFEPDPFAAIPGSPFEVRVTNKTVGAGLCPGSDRTPCDELGAVPKMLAVEFDDCAFTTYQGQITTELQSRGNPYVLETHSAYDCVNGPTVYRWWLRRGT